MKPDGTRLARTLEWIARLPLCGELELAGLLGVDPIDVRHQIHELATRGWVESIVPGSPELELRRLSLVRDEAVPALAAALDLAPADVPRRAPVRLKDTLDRVSRVEITAGVNRFLGDLASDLRRSGVAELVDARSLPLAVPVGERWWLPATEGYGCLRAGNLWAPFFVGWDRAGAPDLYRRRRVAAWSTARAATARRWGAAGLPPILVVCPSLRELRVWERALLRRADDGSSDQIDALLTTRDELQAHGPCGVVWRTPGADGAVSLVERLGWGGAPALLPLELPDELDGMPEQPMRSVPPIREWASRQVTANASAQLWQQVAVLALATGPDEKRLIEWVARHPLVSATELAALLNESESLVERRLDWLTRCGAVCTDPGDSPDDSRDTSRRYVLTELAMRSLAARTGVPADTYARLGGVTFVAPAVSHDRGRVIRHREHTIGINRFFARLASDARQAGWRLDEWRNEAESTRRFIDADGRTSWIRPDSSGVLVHGVLSSPFLLEYDRGTLDAGDYQSKFAGYRRYYQRERWKDDFDASPLLLFICADDCAALRVGTAARREAIDVPLLLSSEWGLVISRAHVAKPAGSAWNSGWLCPDAAASNQSPFRVRGQGPRGGPATS